MRNIISRQLKDFNDDRGGAVAILFGLMTMIIFMCSALAIDYGRGLVAATRLSAALDAASLAGAKALRLQNMTDTEVRDLAQRVFNANLEGNVGTTAATIKTLDILVDRENVKVELDLTAEIDTVLARVMGVNTFAIPRSSAAIFESQDIEVAVQLDVTGSMCDPCTKIDDLKDATKKLVDVLIPDQPTGQKVRIAFAPFSAGVNAGPYADAITDGLASTTGSTCTYERYDDANYQLSDDLPTGLGRMRTRSEVNSGSRGNCSTGAEILPLTDNKTILKSTVESYSTDGYTAGHLGTVWTWYLLSPKWSTIWPTAAKPAAHSADTIKVAILMTDGEYNTFNGYSNSAKSGDAAKATCEEMKNDDIKVYTVGFMLSAGSDAEDIMRSCASDISKAFNAEDGDALKAAFEAIAIDIARLRLSS